MAILSAEIAFRLSGGSGNSDPSTRCYPMMAQRDRPVWDDVMQAQAAAGAAIIKQTRGD